MIANDCKHLRFEILLVTLNQGSNFIAAIAERENKMPWIIAATTAIFCRMVQFLYYSLCITTLILEFRSVDEIMCKSLF